MLSALRRLQDFNVGGIERGAQIGAERFAHTAHGAENGRFEGRCIDDGPRKRCCDALIATARRNCTKKTCKQERKIMINLIM